MPDAGSSQQAQSFHDLHIEGANNSLVINQTLVISTEAVQARPFIDRSPYIGLRRFEEKDQPLFFGRDALVAKLLQAVRDRRLTLVAGASGSGKSSAIRAGLIPLLQARLLRLRVLTMVPDRDPFARLQAALLQSGFDLEQAARATAVSEETLSSLCTKLRPPDESWLIFIDQFEELFAPYAEAARRQAFLDGILRLVESGAPDVKLVLAMRSDFFERFDPYPKLLELAQPAFFITSPSEAELRLCIEQPAARHGVTFEAGLVSEILRDLKDRPGALPLLQYTLDRLWKQGNPGSDRTLKTVDYRALGGISGALQQRADELFAQRAVDRLHVQMEQRPLAQQEAMRRVFLRLLDLSDQGESARAISTRTPLAEFPPDEQQLIAELADEKLLVTSRDQNAATVEVAHEALLTAWPKLKEWIAQARQAIYLRNRLRADAGAWDKARASEAGRADDELWTGSKLQSALEREEHGDFSQLGGLPPLIHEFLSQSRALQERRAHAEQEQRERLARKELEKQQQRNRFLLIGMALLVAGLVSTGGLAYSTYRAKQEALAQKQLAEHSELDIVVEQGRQLLVERDSAVEAALWLQRAYGRGSKSPILPFLLADAMRPVDATLRIFQGHTESVLSASFSLDGTRIVTAGADRTARVWDAKTGQQLRSFEGHTDAVTSAGFSPDGARIVTTSGDKTARVWDARTGQQLPFLLGHEDRVLGASFSPDGTRIVTASADRMARIWDAKTGRLLLPLQGHTNAVTGASFSLDGVRVVTTSRDKTARVWDAKTGQQLLLLLGHTGRILGAGFSPDGTRIITASADKSARVWDAQTGRPLLSLQRDTGEVTGASFSPDGTRIVTAHWDQTARVWDAQTGELLLSLQGHTSVITGAAFSPDGNQIVTASIDKTARLWDAQLGKQELSLQGHRDRVTSASFSRDGSRVVTASGDTTARVWDAQTGKLLLPLQGHARLVSSASFSPDGTRIVTASGDQTARVWDARTGKVLFPLPGHTSVVTSASYSPNGARIVTASVDKTARVWDAKTGQLLVPLQGHTSVVTSASFSRDGSRIVTASGDQTARVWDAQTGQQLLLLQGHTSLISSASFSPDGARIVTATWDATARVWDVKTGKRLLSLRGHTAEVRSASYSEDGTRIVTASGDKTVRVWDAETGRLLHLLQGHTRVVSGASFSADGTRIATAGEDGTARLWRAGAELRDALQIGDLLRCRLALRLEGAAIIQAELAPTACEHIPPSKPLPPRWDQRDWPLWIGIYALQAGNKEAARTALRDARNRLSYFQDGLGLAELELAEAALESPEDAPFPQRVGERVSGAAEDERADFWQRLSTFTQDHLYRPRWAVWAMEHALAVKTERDADLRANLLEMLLASGQAAEALRRGSSVWSAQQEVSGQCVVAALLWLAAGEQASAGPRRSWAQRALDSYVQLEDEARLGWRFHGARHAYSLRPDSALRMQALELFTLLEQPKSLETTAALAKLLGLPVSSPAPLNP